MRPAGRRLPYDVPMRNQLHAVLVAGAIGIAQLVLLGGCSSTDVMQSADAGWTDPGTADGSTSSTSSDLAGSDLAGSDLARSTSGNPESDPKLQGITALHNQARAAVVPQPATAIPALTWDTKVAAAAQLVASTCAFQHSGNGYGENIYASAGSTPTPATVVNDWTAEKANYTYASNTCASGKSCGHYTQVVWRGSLRLGCAQKTCTTGSPFSGFPTWDFWVCDYDPAGNQSGQKPY